MPEYLGDYFILNGELVGTLNFSPSMVFLGESVYEVIRLKDGIPFFFDDHFRRLCESVSLRRRTMLAGLPEIKESVRKLMAASGLKETNIKLVFNYQDDACNWLIYTIPSSYPSIEQYCEGVTGSLLESERNDPASKVINLSLRDMVALIMERDAVHEVLLVNKDGLITEGSRSNIFFVRDNTLFTAPDSLVLKGITRKHILDLCNENSIPVIFRCIKAPETGSCQGVFMTGTSPMVLPFKSLDNIIFDPSLPLISRLRELYSERAELSRTLFLKE